MRPSSSPRLHSLPFICLLFAAATWLPEAQGQPPHHPSIPDGKTMNFNLSSSAFKNGASIPARHTCDGADASPPLAWSGAPAGTRTFALICDDPDAPVGTWVHWVLWNLPAPTTSLPEAVEKSQGLPAGTQQGTNDFRHSHYGGPCPPKGKPHRYFFKLYALDAELALKPGAEKKALLKAMDGHILAQAEWVGIYQRPVAR